VHYASPGIGAASAMDAYRTRKKPRNARSFPVNGQERARAISAMRETPSSARTRAPLAQWTFLRRPTCREVARGRLLEDTTHVGPDDASICAFDAFIDPRWARKSQRDQPGLVASSSRCAGYTDRRLDSVRPTIRMCATAFPTCPFTIR